MTQPIHVFAPPGPVGQYAASSTINPAKLNPGSSMYKLCVTFGALGSFVPNPSLVTFLANFPTWYAFVVAQLSAVGGAPRMSLWLDPTSTCYVLCLNSLLTSAGGLPTGLDALEALEA